MIGLLVRGPKPTDCDCFAMGPANCPVHGKEFRRKHPARGLNFVYLTQDSLEKKKKNTTTALDFF